MSRLSTVVRLAATVGLALTMITATAVAGFAETAPTTPLSSESSANVLAFGALGAHQVAQATAVQNFLQAQIPPVAPSNATALAMQFDQAITPPAPQPDYTPYAALVSRSLLADRIVAGTGVGTDEIQGDWNLASPKALDAMLWGMIQLGKPYVYAAAGPDAFDCSGFTMMAWGSVGVSMPHYSGAQYAMFPKVPLDQLLPGDLLFRGPGGSQHVEMYIGHGLVIAAPHTGDVVKVQPMGSVMGAVRPS
ncbi:MAG: cell wall-associated hydrolase, invasion-associated protein [Actinomycetia bacterium]|nr:cell wall-associated hydrolase, invasion-associated protein [Actinomycetes bacterium]